MSLFSTDGLVEYSNGYLYITFTPSNGSYILFNNSIIIDYIMVGGGGSGGGSYFFSISNVSQTQTYSVGGGGGSGGQVMSGQINVNENTNISVSVGKGGIGIYDSYTKTFTPNNGISTSITYNSTSIQVSGGSFGSNGSQTTSGIGGISINSSGNGGNGGYLYEISYIDPDPPSINFTAVSSSTNYNSNEYSNYNLNGKNVGTFGGGGGGGTCQYDTTTGFSTGSGGNGGTNGSNGSNGVNYGGGGGGGSNFFIDEGIGGSGSDGVVILSFPYSIKTNYLVGNVDIGNIFYPLESNVSKAEETGFKIFVNGTLTDLNEIFYPYTSGTYASQTGYITKNGLDLNIIFQNLNENP